MTPFESRAGDYLARVEHALDRRLPAATTAPASLHQAMRYAILGGGKRIRPLLCYATGEALGLDANLLDDAACAVELVHGFSLVHDDLPCMDDDDLRRGQPTVHRKFGVATAILAGDALQTLAFRILGDGDAAPGRLAMLRTLADAAGSTGMTGGQVMDLEAEGKQISEAALAELNRLKTGCLIRASVLMACDACADFAGQQRNALDTFATHIGLAFQIRDDLLDVEGDAAFTGKTAGADAAHDKSTWPSLLGVDSARQRAKQAYDQAMQALMPMGERAEGLRWLTRRIVYRDR